MNNIFDLINTISDQYKLMLDRELTKELGITYSDWLIMEMLGELEQRYPSEAIKQQTLVQVSQLDKSTVSRRLQHLHKKKLLSRKVNKKSEREKLIKLADEGKQIVTKGRRVVGVVNTVVASSWDAYKTKMWQIELQAILTKLKQQNEQAQNNKH